MTVQERIEEIEDWYYSTDDIDVPKATNSIPWLLDLCRRQGAVVEAARDLIRSTRYEHISTEYNEHLPYYDTEGVDLRVGNVPWFGLKDTLAALKEETDGPEETA